MKPQQLMEPTPKVIEQDDPKRGLWVVYFMLERNANDLFHLQRSTSGIC